MEATSAKSGRRRADRKTRWTVRAADVASRVVITVGGIGTVLSVLTVFFFLLYVAWPLLLPSKTGAKLHVPIPSGESPALFAVDEYRLAGVEASPQGAFRVSRLETGETLQAFRPYSNLTVTATAFDAVQGTALLGFGDGSVRFLKCGFAADSVPLAEAHDPVRRLGVGESCVDGGRVWHRLNETDIRVQGFEVTETLALEAVHASAVRLADFATGPDGLAYATLHEDGNLEVVKTRQRKNILTGKITVSKTVMPVPCEPRGDGSKPAFLLVSGLGDAVSLAWSDGLLRRYDVRTAASIRLLEELDIVPEPGAGLSALGSLLGRSTMLAGDTDGRIRSWFAVNTGEGEAAMTKLVCVQTFEGGHAPVTALASSTRIRMFAAGDSDGAVRLFHATSGKRLADLRLGTPGSRVRAVALAPKDDALAAADASGLATWTLDPRHPEASLRSLFGKVW